ncbi:pantoate--beta-alanine ligase [Limibacillus halophilus]
MSREATMSEPQRRPGVVRSVAELRDLVSAWRRGGDRIGLIPTMGALHEGHLSLIRRAQQSCHRSVATIFVNPLQFDRPGDLAAYPRDEALDLERLAEVGADLLFAPTPEEMYPPNFSTGVMVAGLTEGLCGEHRPGHFGGVATVVTKLLLQALPDEAFFGEKDFQQLRVIQRMARDLNIPSEIIGVETVREADGLALSSRNRHLSQSQRAAAPTLYAVMREMARRMTDEGESAGKAEAWGRRHLSEAGFEKIEYLELRDEEKLQPLDAPVQNSRLFAAAWLGAVRLIDNLKVA